MSLEQNGRDKYIVDYYKHQYERANHLEQQSLTVTNIIVIITTFSLTFGFKDVTFRGYLLNISLVAAVMVCNMFAILYIKRTGRAVRAHHERAYRVLDVYAYDIFNINKHIGGPKRNWLAIKLDVPGRTIIQIGVHLPLIIICIFPIINFLFIFEIDRRRRGRRFAGASC